MAPPVASSELKRPIAASAAPAAAASSVGVPVGAMTGKKRRLRIWGKVKDTVYPKEPPASPQRRARPKRKARAKGKAKQKRKTIGQKKVEEKKEEKKEDAEEAEEEELPSSEHQVLCM